MRRFAGLVVVLAVGCSSSAPPDDSGPAVLPDGGDLVADACGGTRPALADCDVHAFDADCGGTGEPTFACSEESGHCRWFATACVARAHHISDCAALDLCCHTTEDGAWPFADGWTGPAPFGHESVVNDTAVLDGAVVDASTPPNLAVTIDPTYAGASSSFTCTGTLPDGTYFPCGRPFLVLGTGRTTDSFTRETVPNLFGSTLLFEVVTPPDADPWGRVFVSYHTDASRGLRACEPDRGRGLATSGTLTLESVDRDAHGLLVVEVEGGTITVTF